MIAIFTINSNNYFSLYLPLARYSCAKMVVSIVTIVTTR